jgi:hypothetical protein
MIDLKVIKGKAELLEYKERILELFFDSYGSVLSGELWDWAYLTNPFGDPYVALAFDGSLVGHYAVIPFPLKNDDSQFSYKSFLSMTTMVAPSHRKYGLFTRLAEQTYEEMKLDGADWVMGFPNEMSAPGFRKRLGWDVLDTDHIVSIARSQLFLLQNAAEMDAQRRYFADFSDREMREWRLSKPGASYEWKNGMAYKEYNGQIDVIYCRSYEDVLSLPKADFYNILIDSSFARENRLKSFSYLFGGLGLSCDFSPHCVQRQMCLSDVF